MLIALNEVSIHSLKHLSNYYNYSKKLKKGREKKQVPCDKNLVTFDDELYTCRAWGRHTNADYISIDCYTMYSDNKYIKC